MTAPWFATDEDVWEEGAAELPKPWPEAFARMDLRYHENRARMKAAAFPGRVALTARWGWTDRQVRRLLDADNWHDPTRPVAREDLRQKWAGVQRAANEPPTDRPTERQRDNGPTPNIPANPPTDRQRDVQRSANEASIARASSEPRSTTEPQTTQEAAPAAPSEPPGAPDATQAVNVDPAGGGAGRGPDRPGPEKPATRKLEEDALYATYRIGRPRAGATPTPDTRKHLRRILTECGSLDAAGLYLAWTFQSQDERARQVRGEVAWPGGRVNAMISLEELGRHVGSRMPMAEAWDAGGRGVAPSGPPPTQAPPGATDEAQRAWEWVCALVARVGQGEFPPDPTNAWEARAREALRRMRSGWQRVKGRDDFTRRAVREEFVGRWTELEREVAA